MRKFAVVLAVALSFAGLASPSYADKHKVSDATGDVIAFSGEGDEVPAPENVNTDVITSVANYSNKRVSIRARFVDLKAGDAKAGLFAQIKTNKLSYELGLGSGFDLITRRGKTIKCAGKTKAVSVTEEFIEMSVPRKCLGSPRWIKVGIGAIGYVDPEFYWDDALRSGIRKDGNLTFGPRLKRG